MPLNSYLIQCVISAAGKTMDKALQTDMNRNGRRLRLLIIAPDTFPPYRPDIQILYGEKIASRGHTIDMILPSSDECVHVRNQEWNNLTVTVTPSTQGMSFKNRVIRNIQNAVYDLVFIKKTITSEYDYVQIRDKFTTVITFILFNAFGKKNLIYWLSFSLPELYKYKAKHENVNFSFLYFLRGAVSGLILYRIVPKFAKHIFVQSERMKKDFTNRGVSEAKLTAVPMGISASALPPVEHTAGNQPGNVAKRFIYVGALDRPRHLDFLVRAFAIIIKEVPYAEMFFIGSATNRDDVSILKNEARRLGVTESVTFTGFLHRSEVWEHVKASQICLSPMFPSPMLITTTPTKCIEYMAMGKPVIGNSEIPDMEYVLNESGGGLCVPWDEKAFSEAGLELLRDPGKARRMGIKGREWVLKHREYERIADIVESKYYELL